jgi:hypothetical protein
MLHYNSLLKSGKNPLISWNSMLGGAYPDPIEPKGWEQCLENRDKPILQKILKFIFIPLLSIFKTLSY